MKLKTKVVLPQTEEKTTSVAATLSEKTRENCTSSNSGFYTWLMTNNEEYLLGQLTAIMEKPVPPTLGELKEPTHVVPKGRTKGTKRSATAVEILEEKIKNEEKKAIKRKIVKEYNIKNHFGNTKNTTDFEGTASFTCRKVNKKQTVAGYFN